jgi:glucose/arabinose dehydrogenase
MIAQLLAATCASIASCVSAATPMSFTPVVSGLQRPDYVTSAPGRPSPLYVVEQPGRIVTVEGGQITGTFLDIRPKVSLDDERGLLSLAFSPRYAQDRRFYVYYTDTNGDIRIEEYRSDGTTAIPSSARQIFFARHKDQSQNGGQLVFDRGGYLYAGTGDANVTGAGDPAQILAAPLGKLMRIKPLAAGAKWQTIGYGLRNPWRFTFDRATGDLWIGDVGAGKWEEIDFRSKANVGRLANYGWHRYEGKAVFDSHNPLGRAGELVSPIWEYGHSGGACSVTGGYVYRGAAVPAARGRYFFGDFCNGRIWSMRVSPGRGLASAPRQEPFTVPKLTSFGEDAAGELYATSFDGTLYRLTP